jgi:hypothetical protein
MLDAQKFLLVMVFDWLQLHYILLGMDAWEHKERYWQVSCAKTIFTSCHEAGEDSVHGKDQLGQAQTFAWETGACLVGASYCCLKEQCLW